MAAPILQDRPITARDAVIPYAVAGLNILAPIVAAGLLNILLPSVFVASVAVVFIGLPLSLFFRQRRTNRFWLYFLTTTMLIVLAWALAGQHAGLEFDWRDPVGSLVRHSVDERFRGILQVFSLFAAGRAFQLLSARDMLQTPIPGFPMFFMVAYVLRGETPEAMGQNAVSLVCLALLCASTLYILAHEQGGQWVAIQLPPRLQRVVLWQIARFMLIFFPIAAVLGWLASPLNGPQMAASHPQAGLPNISGLMQSVFGAHAGVGMAESVRMDGGNWPSGKQRIMTVGTSARGGGQLWRGVSYSQYANGEWRRGSESNKLLDKGTDYQTWNAGVDGHAESTVRIPLFRNDHTQPSRDPALAAALRAGLLKPLPRPDGDEPAPVKPITPDDPMAPLRLFQRFTLVAPVMGEMPLYGAFQIEEVRAGNNSLSERATVAGDGSVALPATVVPITKYDVTSIIKPMPSAFRLPKPIVLEESMRKAYLQLPADAVVAQRIRAMALAVLEEARLTPASEPQRVVDAFQSHLARNYHYSLTPKPVAGNGDPTADFLFTQKEGYCVYFASAFVLLCRSVDIPARFVTGFANGTEQGLRSTNGDILLVVTNEDAHAWAEVFLPHYGWYTVDPTAGSIPVPTTWQRSWNFFADTFEAVRGFFLATVNLVREDARLRAYINLAVAFILVSAAGLIYWRRERPPRMPKRALSDPQARDFVLAAYARMLRWLRLWGVSKPDGMTASVFQDRLHALNPEIAAPAGGIADLYVLAHYGETPICDDDARRAVELLHELWRVGRRERRHLHARDTEAQDA